MEAKRSDFRKKKIRRNTDMHGTSDSRFTNDFDLDEGTALKKRKKKTGLKKRSKSRIKRRAMGSTMNIGKGRSQITYKRDYFFEI